MIEQLLTQLVAIGTGHQVCRMRSEGLTLEVALESCVIKEKSIALDAQQPVFESTALA